MISNGNGFILLSVFFCNMKCIQISQYSKILQWKLNCNRTPYANNENERRKSDRDRDIQSIHKLWLKWVYQWIGQINWVPVLQTVMLFATTGNEMCIEGKRERDTHTEKTYTVRFILINLARQFWRFSSIRLNIQKRYFFCFAHSFSVSTEISASIFRWFV